MEYIRDSFGLIENLRAARFTLKLQVQERISLPEYKGSTFRGVLGWQLKKIICINRDSADCSACLLSPKCLYNYLFSPPLPPNTQFLQHTSHIPSPIIIEPPLTNQRTFEPGDTMEVSLVLIGKGLEYLPYLLYTFCEIGKYGIGARIHQHGGRRRGGRFEVQELRDAIGGNVIYSGQDKVMRDSYQTFGWPEAVAQAEWNTGRLSLEFLTPVRLKERQGEKSHLSRLSSFSQLITHLYWRLLLLSYFHCNPWNLDDERLAGLADEASQMRKDLAQVDDIRLMDNQTYWREYDRWSNRQRAKMTLGGFMGRATFSGNLVPYLPLLHLGQYTHLGKQTMFGLGKYKIIKSITMK